MLIDKGLQSYLGKFTIKMQPPTTQEEIDRRENTVGRIGIVRDVMDLLTDVDNPATKLKILKILLSNVISDSDITSLLEEQIDELEQPGLSETSQEEEDLGLGSSSNIGSDIGLGENEPLDLDTELGLETETEISPEEEEDILPTPEEAGEGEDFTDNNLEF